MKIDTPDAFIAFDLYHVTSICSWQVGEPLSRVPDVDVGSQQAVMFIFFEGPEFWITRSRLENPLMEHKQDEVFSRNFVWLDRSFRLGKQSFPARALAF